MINATSLRSIVSLLCAVFFTASFNLTYACHGSGLGNASTFYDGATNETVVTVEFCLGVTDLFGLPSGFDISIDGATGVPTLDPNSSTLTSTYYFNQNAEWNGIYCDCDDSTIGIPPTILTNTDTWTATTSAGTVSYAVNRSNPQLTEECQIDCVDGSPLALTGGQTNYLTDISACFLVEMRFEGFVEDQLVGVNMTGSENGVCDDEGNMSFSLTGALAVELQNFNATQNENSVTINWSTSSENDVYKYIVERSADGLSNFEALGDVPVFGNSQTLKNYDFQDMVPLAKSYYRLKTMDIDGQTSYSTVVLVEKTIQDLRMVNVYPNPVMGMTEIIYETKANANVHFKVFDVNGSLKVDQVVEAKNGFNKVPFDFTGLREGIYFISIESGKEKVVKRVTKF